MSKIGQNKYPNIFGSPRLERTNIQIYLDQGKTTNFNMLNLLKLFEWDIDDLYLCVFTKTDQNKLKLAIYCQNWSREVSAW